MSAHADLELSLHRYDAENYNIEARYAQPDSDADIRVMGSGLSVAQFDRERLLAHQLDPIAYGRALGENLFADQLVHTMMTSALTAAATADVPLRVRLMIGRSAPELHSLRWEMLQLPGDNGVLATKEQVLFSRYLSSTDWRPVRLRSQAALRMLIVAANPTDLEKYQLAPLQVEDELERVRTAMDDGMIGQELPSGGSATLNNIVHHLRDGYDILYLICHGSMVGGNPILWLEDESGASARVTGGDFATRLQEIQERPRLIVLASCNSAGTGKLTTGTAGDTLAALGPRLAEIGIPAVLAMQGLVSVESVRAFMPVFFEELCRDGEIDRAVAAARGAIRGRPDWWVPALFMRMKSGRIWYAPGFGDSRGELEQWRSLLRNIERGKCTPVLGPGLSESLLGSRRQVAQRWAQTYDFPMAPHEQEDFAQVTQYIGVNHGWDFVRDELLDYLRSQLLEQIQSSVLEVDDLDLGKTISAKIRSSPSMNELFSMAWNLQQRANIIDSHTVLAQLPIPVYITTEQTQLLIDALQAAGKAPRVELCRWNVYMEDLPSIQDDSQYRPSIEEPLVYHLFGSMDEPDSLVLTEDDYFNYLIGVTSNKELIPEVVRRSLVDKALLFLGFRMDEWEFRVLFRSIIEREGRSKRRGYAHIAAQIDLEEGRILEPERARRYLESYFEQSDINIYWGRVEDFIKELDTRRGGKSVNW